MSFSHLLTNADKLGKRFLEAAKSETGPQLITVATDGETFGGTSRSRTCAWRTSSSTRASRSSWR